MQRLLFPSILRREQSSKVPKLDLFSVILKLYGIFYKRRVFPFEKILMSERVLKPAANIHNFGN